MYIETSFHYVDHILEYYRWENFQKHYKLKSSRYNKCMLTCTCTTVYVMCIPIQKTANQTVVENQILCNTNLS